MSGRLAPQTWLPGLAQFTGYRRSWLRGDVLAGVTVAALVPMAVDALRFVVERPLVARASGRETCAITGPSAPVSAGARHKSLHRAPPRPAR